MLVKINATFVLNQNKLIRKSEFIDMYGRIFYLNKDKIAHDLKNLKQSFTCVFSTRGPIIFTTLWNKKPKFCWGEYAFLLNLQNIERCWAIGGTTINFSSNPDYPITAIHPNIHSNLYADYGSKFREIPYICLGNVLKDIVYTCIKNGELDLACTEIVHMLNNTKSSDDLFKFWKNIFFSRCKDCYDVIELRQQRCRSCSNN